MTDLVLVNPPTSAAERYGRLAEGGSKLPPLGLALLAGIAREAGFSVAVLDAEALGLTAEQTCERILQLDPSVAGFTAVTMTVHAAAEVAQLLKSAGSRALTVIGGVHVSAVPEETMEAFGAFDAAVLNEGDATLPELLAAVRAGEELAGVAGLLLRDGSRLVRTAPRELTMDLDALPMPAWDLLPDLAETYRPAPNAYRRLPSSSLVSSRGCPGACTFCDRTVSGSRVRSYSAAYLMRMVETLHAEYGIRDIIFHDDNFLASRKRVFEFCALLEQAGLDLVWSCTGRVDAVSPELLSAMKRAGCWQVAYGVETGSQELLDELCKGTTLEQVRTAVAWTHAAGIE
ncbi:MAG: B12-binding domain-containing radical SAM protein, partial [Actinobacteria bacterium]